MKTAYKFLIVLAVIMFSSCEDNLTELNINPNGVDPSVVNPNLMLPTILVGTANPYLEMNYEGDVAGVMQYVQKSGWGGGLNNLDWRVSRDWGGWYTNLRNTNHVIARATELNMEFQQGVGYVIRAFNFGFIADSWGPAPYTKALNAPAGSQEDYFPPFDTQETIYKGIIEELKTANTLLSRPRSQYSGISADADVIYQGDPEKWRKFANSLMLRFYMRLSEKLPAYAQAGIEEILSNPAQYPIFMSNADDAAMAYVGASRENSWPVSVAFDASESGFDRIQLAAGLRDVLMEYDDPRLGVWFNPVRVQIVVSTEHGQGDNFIGDKRYLHPDYMEENNMVVYNSDTWVADIAAGKTLVDVNLYAGVPVAYHASDASTWNLNPQPIQGGSNVHNSALADMFKGPAGPMLRARLVSYAEVCFILAEAAQKGWSAGGTQQEWYEKGVQASFNTWGVGTQYAAYIAQPGVAYDGTLEQIITQKWIANFTVAHESWNDWRRTGYPVLSIGPGGLRQSMPWRYQYPNEEIARNNQNYQNAISTFVQTPFTATDGDDSSWSKTWLHQD